MSLQNIIIIEDYFYKIKEERSPHNTQNYFKQNIHIPSSSPKFTAERINHNQTNQPKG
jgi:hypothetical protein